MARPLHREKRSPTRTALTSLKAIGSRLAGSLCDELRSRGFKVPPYATRDAHKALVAMLRVKDRSVDARPRTVSRSRELQARQLSAAISAALNEIERESVRGADLNPRLTRQFFRADYNDALHADLRIQHFHLGQHGAGKNGQVGGTSELLFAAVTDTELLFFDVLHHDAFNNGRFVEMISSNWPRLLGPALQGITPGRAEPGVPVDVTRAKMRRAGLVTTIDLDGVAHMPPGLGVMADGTPVLVVVRANRLIGALGVAYEWLEHNADEYADILSERLGRPVGAFNLSARVHGDVVAFHELESGAMIYPFEGRLAISGSYAERRVMNARS